MLSLGFRPTWLKPDRTWQLAAIVSLAMVDAATASAGLADNVIRLKWPNDLVVLAENGHLLKLGGVLGETEGLGTADPRVVVGIGVNTDWQHDHFPTDLADTMTSLRETAPEPHVDFVGLLAAFVDRLGPRLEALRAGQFDSDTWARWQVTTGRTIRLERRDGTETVHALGVDGRTGALVVADPEAADGRRHVLVGEIRRVRLSPAIAAQV